MPTFSPALVTPRVLSRSRLAAVAATVLFVAFAAAIVGPPANALSTTCTWKGTTGSDTKTITAAGVYCAAAGDDTINVDFAGTAADPVVIAPGNGTDTINVNTSQTDNAGLIIAQPTSKTTTVTPAGGVTGSFRCVTNASYTPSATTNVLTIRPLGAANCVTAATSAVTVDSANSTGLHTSMQLDANGYPVISYHVQTGKDLELAHCGNANCTAGNTITTVHDDGTNTVGQYTSLQLDANGYPVISYYDASGFDLELAHCGNANCSAGNTLTTVDDTTTTTGLYTSQRLDANGYPVISYHDQTGGDLEVAHCGNANCNAGNTLTTIESTNSTGQFTSLQLDAAGNPVSSYYYVTGADLKVAHCTTANCR